MKEHHGKFVSYLRVSTIRQGESGLGLEAQRQAVAAYLNGGNWELLKEFQEVESGKGSNALSKRPVLRETLAYCKANKATLVIAKLDRLARNVRFTAELLESRVEFLCADNPHANKLSLHLLSAVGEHERDMISSRTKAALAVAKARGTKLGNPRISELIEPRKRTAKNFAEALRPTIEKLQAEKLSQRKIVFHLNEKKIPTAGGGPWTQLKLQRVLSRLQAGG